MEFTRMIETNLPFADAEHEVRAALAHHGFGILFRIDVRETFAGKLGIDFDEEVILGACNPMLAHTALCTDPHTAALLPWNVVIHRTGGKTVIETLQPEVLVTVTGNEALGPVVLEATHKLGAALDDVAALAPVR